MSQSVLVMDEFRGSWCPYEILLRILDGHPYQPEQKGGHVWAAYTTVYITSNINPVDWYSTVKIADQSPLFRRITEIYYVEKPLYEDCVMTDVRDKPVKYFPVFAVAAMAKQADVTIDREWDMHSEMSNEEFTA